MKDYSFRSQYADKLEHAAESSRASAGAATLYRVYTECFDTLTTPALEIIGSYADRRQVLNLATDICDTNGHASVMVTMHGANGFNKVMVSGRTA